MVVALPDPGPPSPPGDFRHPTRLDWAASLGGQGLVVCGTRHTHRTPMSRATIWDHQPICRGRTHVVVALTKPGAHHHQYFWRSELQRPTEAGADCFSLSRLHQQSCRKITRRLVPHMSQSTLGIKRCKKSLVMAILGGILKP